MTRSPSFSDENNQERHVDKDLWTTVPKVVLYNLRNTHWNLQDPGHYPSGHHAREYARTSLAMVRLRANATIGESVTNHDKIKTNKQTNKFPKCHIHPHDTHTHIHTHKHTDKVSTFAWHAYNDSSLLSW